MNPLKKAFCRVYQLAFYAAIPFLPYREPETFDRIEDLEPLLKKLGVTSLLLVTDNGLRGAGLTTPLEAMLKQSGISCSVYDNTRANPTAENVEEAVLLYRENGCQANDRVRRRLVHGLCKSRRRTHRLPEPDAPSARRNAAYFP